MMGVPSVFGSSEAAMRDRAMMGTIGREEYPFDGCRGGNGYLEVLTFYNCGQYSLGGSPPTVVRVCL